MATSITTIQSTDLITNSRADINNNFDSLLVNKIETDVLSTDSTFTAASDSKIPSQLAVKQYVDAGGNVNASITTKGIVEEADATETLAGTAVGGTGARLFVNPSNLAGYMSAGGYISKIGTGVTSRDMTTVSGAQTIAHGLAVTPKLVRITVHFSDEQSASSSATVSHVFSVYSNSVQSSVHTSITSSSGSTTNYSRSGNTFKVYTSANATYYQTGVITTDSTNITITWTKSGTAAGTAYIVWEALA